MHTYLRLIGALVVMSLLVASCAGDDEAALTTTAPASTEMSDNEMSDDAESEDMDMDMNMGDAGAEPANEVPNAEVESGTFVLLDSRPPGYDEVTGQAFLARHDAGTTVSITLEGLAADTSFIAHVHEGLCSESGGDHYKFDPDGSDLPPNEIHLAFVSDGAGMGFMTAENDAVVSEDARSLVVHPSDLLDNKLACVEFAP